MRSENHSEIINYYDKCQLDYELIWHLKTHNCMHYGYWDKKIKRLRDALHKTNDVIASLGNIIPNSLVADLGCGVGGPANYIAKKYNCYVKGISISQKQIIQATELSKILNVQDSVFFSNQDYCNTTFNNEEFDLAYAIESSCYAIEKTVFLEEGFRILKQNGKFIILDFFWSGKKNNKLEVFLMKKWTEAWGIKDYENENIFINKLEQAGFVNIRKININENVRKSVNRLHLCFYPGILINMVLLLFGIRDFTQTKNTLSSLYQYLLFRKKVWNYNIIYAEKP